MITKMFCIYDSKALNFGVPFFMPSVGAAVRIFSDVANDSQSTIHRHPSDYILFHVADFDDSDASVRAVVPMVQLGIGSDFVFKQSAPADFVIDSKKIAEIIPPVEPGGK